MQDLENDGPNHRDGKCRTWNMMEKSQGWKMQDQIILPLVEYVLIH